MRLHPIILCTGVIAGLAFSVSVANAQPGMPKKICDVESIKRDASKNDGVRSALSDPVSSSRCASLMLVLRQIVSGKIKAGRQLEASAAFDRTAAQRELEAARSQPDIRAAVAHELEGVSNPNEKLLLEAVVMHEKQQLLARDLLLQQLGASQ